MGYKQSYFRAFNCEVVKREFEFDMVETTTRIDLPNHIFEKVRKHESIELVITLQSSGNTTGITNEQIIEEVYKRLNHIV